MIRSDFLIHFGFRLIVALFIKRFTGLFEKITSEGTTLFHFFLAANNFLRVDSETVLNLMGLGLGCLKWSRTCWQVCGDILESGVAGGSAGGFVLVDLLTMRL